MILEIFYDAQFYDLELLIESRDASEVRSSGSAGSFGRDASKYKGSKRVHAEFEPGDYTIKVVARLPGTETKDLELKYWAPDGRLLGITRSTGSLDLWLSKGDRWSTEEREGN